MVLEGLIRDRGFSPKNLSDSYLLVFVLVPSAYLSFFIMLTRIWLLYYNIHLTKLQKQKIWLNAINPNAESQNCIDWIIS